MNLIQPVLQILSHFGGWLFVGGGAVLGFFALAPRCEQEIDFPRFYYECHNILTNWTSSTPSGAGWIVGGIIAGGALGTIVAMILVAMFPKLGERLGIPSG